MTPRWRENPEQIRQLVARCHTADKSVRDDSLGGVQAALATLPDMLARAGVSALREDAEGCLHEARTLLAYLALALVITPVWKRTLRVW